MDAAWVGDPALVLCAWEPGLGSKFHSSPGEASTAMPQLQSPTSESGAGPICIPALSTILVVVSAHPWLGVFFSRSPFQTFISGVCFPLYFYFQLDSGRQCKADPSTLLVFCPPLYAFLLEHFIHLPLK